MQRVTLRHPTRRLVLVLAALALGIAPAAQASGPPVDRAADPPAQPSWWQRSVDSLNELLPQQPTRGTPRSGQADVPSRTGGAGADLAAPSGRAGSDGPERPSPDAEPVPPQKRDVGGPDMALALTAARISYGETVEEHDVRRAAAILGLSVSSPPTDDELDRVRRRAWGQARPRFDVAGISYGAWPDADDVARAAKHFGVRIGARMTPAHVVAVEREGRRWVHEQFDRAGVRYGSRVDIVDLRTASHRLGVRYGKRIDPVDTRTIAKRVGASAPTPVMAELRGIKVRLPAHDARLAGFHQASARRAIAMHPRRSPTATTMSSRGRSSHRWSAVDVVLPPSRDVRAPVTGRVVEMSAYRLYGKAFDYRIRIVPDDNPRLITTVLHTTRPQVRRGDHVEAGRTVIARGGRLLPFDSQIDRYTGVRWPHVHIETRHR